VIDAEFDNAVLFAVIDHVHDDSFTRSDGCKAAARRRTAYFPLSFHFNYEVGPLEPNSRTSTTCYEFTVSVKLRTIQAFRSEVSRNS
jgi:hypothetical protein